MITEKIEIFIEVAEALTFSAVAKAHYTTQPTISRQIGALEEEWGMELFERTNKGLRLTPEGSIMFRTCKKMLRQCETGLKLAHEFQNGQNDSLTLGFLQTFDTERIFLPYIQKFAAKYPNLDLSVYSYSFGNLRKGLQNGQLDIIYTLDFDIPNMQDDIVVNYLKKLPLYFGLSEQHPLYRKTDLSLEDCGSEIFYLPSEADSKNREKDLRLILNMLGISNGMIRFTPNIQSAYLQMRLGKGIALLDASTREMHGDGIRLLPVGHNVKPPELVAVWKKENLNPFLPLFVNQQEVEVPGSESLKKS